MQAMEYECLLRMVYQCGRNASMGADADIYRKMEREHHNLTTKSLYATQEIREYEFSKSLASVKINVRDAILSSIKKIGDREDIEKLESFATELRSVRFNSKGRIDEIINNATDIFMKHGLQVR